ncbi:MAG TPA: site-2 protease family protein [Candidatus Limnocylindria bacterium]
MSGTFRIARIAGIDIRVHFSWIVIFLLVTFSLASSVLPQDWSDVKQVAVAVVAALLFFVSVLAHELAHSLVARRFGMSVSSITLFLLGGVANLKQEPPRAAVELLMAIAGPLTSFALGGLAYVTQLAAANVLDARAMETIAPVTSYLTVVNIAVGLFNLVPGFPMDGGRVLRAVIWRMRRDRTAATRIAARGGHVVALGLGLLGAYLLVTGDTFGLWYFVIAYFLYNLASASLEQEMLEAAAAGVRVADVMSTRFVSAGPDMTIDAAVNEVLLPSRMRVVPVVDGSRLVGLVAIRGLSRIPRERWPVTRVEAVMTPAAGLPVLAPDMPLVTAIERFEAYPLVPVARDDALVGIVYPETVVLYLRTREALGLTRTAPGQI